METKGQIEMMAILGIVAVVIVVAYYALTTGVIFLSPVPQAVGEEQKMISDSVTKIGSDGASMAIEWLEKQGGYITPDINRSVIFTKVAVPYWQRCGDFSMVPTLMEITNRLEGAVKGYINKTLYGKNEYFGKNVSIDLAGMSVSANILSEEVGFLVRLPTTVQGHAIGEPYRFSVPTKLGRIYEFAKGFAEENARNRFLEHYTTATIYFSGELETDGVLTGCGRSIFQSGEMTKEGLHNAIRYTLANMMWWQPMQAATDKSKAYSIASVKGKTYPELGIGLYLPDNFALSTPSPLSITNNKPLVSVLFFTAPECLAVYGWKYSVDYPVIVRVADSTTGHYFNFAVLVDVKNLLPGDCTDSGKRSGSPIDMNCSASIKVVGSSGNPIEGASANFGGYYINRSGADGMISGHTICGTNELYVERTGYGPFNTNASSNISESYALYKVPETEFKFKDVEIKEYSERDDLYSPLVSYKKCWAKDSSGFVLLNLSSGRGDYIVSNVDTSVEVPYGCVNSPKCQSCKSGGNLDDCVSCNSACGVSIAPSTKVDYIPGGSYYTMSDEWSRATFRAAGGFMDSYDIPEYNASFFVNTPQKSMLFMENDDKLDLTADMRSKCGISPLSVAAPGSFIEMYGCGCYQLRKMAENELSFCMDVASVFDGCDKAKETAAINGCGFELRGC